MTAPRLPRFAAADKVNDICCTRNIIETGNMPLPRFASLSIPCFIQIGKVLLTYHIQHVLIMIQYLVNVVSQETHTLLLNIIFAPRFEIQQKNTGTNIFLYAKAFAVEGVVEIYDTAYPVISHSLAKKRGKAGTTYQIAVQINGFLNIGKNMREKKSEIGGYGNMCNASLHGLDGNIAEHFLVNPDKMDGGVLPFHHFMEDMLVLLRYPAVHYPENDILQTFVM